MDNIVRNNADFMWKYNVNVYRDMIWVADLFIVMAKQRDKKPEVYVEEDIWRIVFL